jgi:hypothetical protein
MCSGEGQRGLAKQVEDQGQKARLKQKRRWADEGIGGKGVFIVQQNGEYQQSCH